MQVPIPLAGSVHTPIHTHAGKHPCNARGKTILAVTTCHILREIERERERTRENVYVCVCVYIHRVGGVDGSLFSSYSPFTPPYIDFFVHMSKTVPSVTHDMLQT